MKLPKTYLYFYGGVMLLWLCYMTYTDGFGLFIEAWPISLTMVFGSLVAGATSEGGGAIAFPVFTLLFDLSPALARNFSFAIQSVGMLAASILIFSLKIKIEKKAILYTSIGGIIGLVFGTLFLDGLFSPKMLKLTFVSLWLSFGAVLYIKNSNKKTKFHDRMKEIGLSDALTIIFFGFIGGIITAFFGNGVDILTFCLLTLYYRINEKITTPTSIVIMTIHTIIGFAMHVFVVRDFQEQVFNFWLCSIPVVIIFAPLGAYIVSRSSRERIAYFLKSIVLIQYLGAVIILKLSFELTMMSVLTVLLGCCFFYLLLKLGEKRELRLDKRHSIL